MKRMVMKSAAALVLGVLVTGCIQPQTDTKVDVNKQAGTETLTQVGQGSAYTRLALMYKNGQGVDQNTTHAMELFKKGCADKDPVACTNLAAMEKAAAAAVVVAPVVVAPVVTPTTPVVPSNVNANDLKSFQLYTKSCNKGVARACSSLARMYEMGIGTNADKAKAKDAYKKACDLKLPIACKNYDRLSK
jgi:TPR repeat protein